MTAFDRLLRSVAGTPIPPQSRLAARLKAPVRRWLLKSGVMQWGTKSFEFWTLLMIVLGVVRPRSIVELGAGRSTSYLAEYAMKTGARYASIEQSGVYARRVRRGLSLTFVDPRFVHHVPVGEDGWYDAARLAKVVDFEPDMLFIDGPVGRDEEIGCAGRSGDRALDWQRRTVRTASILIVDDVHRRSNLALYESLLRELPPHRSMYVAYEPQRAQRNVAAIALPADGVALIARMCADLRIDLLSDYTVEDCTEA